MLLKFFRCKHGIHSLQESIRNKEFKNKFNILLIALELRTQASSLSLSKSPKMFVIYVGIRNGQFLHVVLSNLESGHYMIKTYPGRFGYIKIKLLRSFKTRKKIRMMTKTRMMTKMRTMMRKMRKKRYTSYRHTRSKVYQQNLSKLQYLSRIQI